jgi:TRAP-type C4-dicarboxylate transport system permease small subunit
MRKALEKLHQIIFKIETKVLILAFAVMGIIMAFQVFSRTLFGRSIVWSEELTRHIFIWTTFIGMSYGIARLSHINLDYFILKFPSKIRKIIEIIMNLVLFGMLITLFRFSLVYVVDQIEIKGPTTGYSMGYVMAAMPVSCVLGAIHLVYHLINQITSLNMEKS